MCLHLPLFSHDPNPAFMSTPSGLTQSASLCCYLICSPFVEIQSAAAFVFTKSAPFCNQLSLLPDLHRMSGDIALVPHMSPLFFVIHSAPHVLLPDMEPFDVTCVVIYSAESCVIAQSATLFFCHSNCTHCVIT